MTHDYKRNGTTTLFAALNLLNGEVMGRCQARPTHVEWLKFLRQIDRQTPKDRALHLIADNYATHKHPAVQERLTKHPRFGMHFAPTSASWLNRRQSAAMRRVRRRGGTGLGYRRIHRSSQHQTQAIHLDQERRRYPAESRSRQQPLKL